MGCQGNSTPRCKKWVESQQSRIAESWFRIAIRIVIQIASYQCSKRPCNYPIRIARFWIARFSIQNRRFSATKLPNTNLTHTHKHCLWELLDPIVEDPVAQDNHKRIKYKYGCNLSGWAGLGQISQKSPSLLSKTAVKHPHLKGGACLNASSSFILIFASFCLCFSPLPLLLDIFMPKNGPPNEVLGK